MGILTQEVEVILNPANVKWYESKGYIIHREKDKWDRMRIPRGTTINVRVEDLTPRSHIYVLAKCDNPNCDTQPTEVLWSNYKRRHDGKTKEYYCQKCAVLLQGTEKTIKAKLEKSISFEEWCHRNNEEDSLQRWDYSKNKKSPSEICYSANKSFWFKCGNGIHESELHNINKFTNYENRTTDCRRCNSFGQFLLNNYGEDGIKMYWSKENTADPFKLYKSSAKKVKIICQNDKTHDDYEVSCANFSKENGNRCPSCNESKGEQIINEYLMKNIINYKIQHSFENLIGLGNGLLSYDFYLPIENLLIEYQGLQHYEPVKYFGGLKQFKKQQKHDKLKRDYAITHNIRLLEIPYWDYDNIEKILDRQLNNIL